MNEYLNARRRMVELIRGEGVKDENVLKALLKVPRHEFVLPEFRELAYSDNALPILEGQTISQPLIVGLMTSLLELKGNERVLEVGTGSGYQAAVLGELCREVYSIEIIPKLAERAEQTLKGLGYENVFVTVGDGSKGLKSRAPFDCIMVTASARKVPGELFKQLKEGGIMVLPVGSKLLKVRKIKGSALVENVAEVAFVPLVESK